VIERWWWLTSKRMTITVRTLDNMIVQTPPIVRKFRGAPISNLTRWMHTQGGFYCKIYPPEGGEQGTTCRWSENIDSTKEKRA
jgi:hypothetical protein